MKKIIKKVVGIFLAMTIMLASSSNIAFASAVVDKEEIVYVSLNHEGDVNAIYVINSFNSPEAGTLNDRGNYSRVVNLSTSDTLTLSDNKVTGTIPAGTFYYQGYLKTTQIPWDITVRYTLDGATISGNELAGKTGHLTIEVSIIQKSGSSIYKDFYAIQSTVTLEGEKARNIISENATIASVGNDKQLSYITLPGENQHISISVDVTDFEMAGMSFNMIPFSLDIDDPDTSDIKARLQELQNGAIDLDDGAVKFLNGITKIEDGVGELSSGVGELKSGANTLLNGSQQLHNGGTAIANGSVELQTGANNFGTGIAGLHGQSSALTEGSLSVKEGLNDLSTAVSGMDAEEMAYAKAQALLLQGGSTTYLDTLNGLIATYESQYAVADETGKAYLGETIAVLQGLRDSYTELDAGVQTMIGTVAAQADTLPEMASGVQALATEYGELHKGIVEYTGGVGELNTGFAEIKTGINDLVAGASELGSGAKEFHAGVQTFYNGTDELSGGIGDLQSGVRELRDGAEELTGGTSELRLETADMDKEMDKEIEKLLDTYRTKDFKAVSFADGGNSTVKSVQFTLMTPEITEQEEKEAPITQERELSIWERFIRLFWKEDE